MFTKFATAEIIETRSAPERVKGATLERFSSFSDFKTDDGYIYTRVRAISSRVNKNHDGWPSEQLAQSYLTFLGKPIFVDHNNSDPSRARGVVVDAKLHIEDDLAKASSFDPYYANAPDNHKPPTWIELLLEVDAKHFPHLAKAIVSGDIDSVSMGCDVERSRCSVCENVATTPEEYCTHVQHKGALFDVYSSTGERISKLAYEDCYDISFFEISYVFDPADETALVFDRIAKVAAVQHEGERCASCGSDLEAGECPVHVSSVRTAENPLPQSMELHAPEHVNTLRQEKICPICGSDMEEGHCDVCNFVEPPEGFDNPDLEKARLNQEMGEQAAAPMAPPPPEPGMAAGGPPPPPGGAGAGGPSPMAMAAATRNGEGAPAVTIEKTAAQQPVEKPILPIGRITSDMPVNPRAVKDNLTPIQSSNGMKMPHPNDPVGGLNEFAEKPGEDDALAPRPDVTDTSDLSTEEFVAALLDAGFDEATAYAAADVAEQLKGHEEKRFVTAADAVAEPADHANTSIDQVGGEYDNAEGDTSHENVEKKVDIERIHTDTWSGGEGDSAGQHSPVTPEVGSSGSGPIGEALSSAKQGAGFPDHEPTKVNLEAPLKEEVGDPTKTFGSDDFHITEPVTADGNGNELGGPIGSPVSHVIEAMRLADTEVEMGLVDAEYKYARASALQKEPLAVIQARLDTLSMVKKAGLKRTSKRVASALPPLSANSHVGSVSTSIDDASIEDAIW